MKKSEQETINWLCKVAIETYNKYVDEHDFVFDWSRLDYCTAWTADVGDYYVLKSYNTIIAIIYKPTGVMYDVLRYVYGYTSTSAKHIAKFRRYAKQEMTYRNI